VHEVNVDLASSDAAAFMLQGIDSSGELFSEMMREVCGKELTMPTRNLAPLLAMVIALAGCATGKDDVQPEAKQKEAHVVKADKDGVQRVRIVGGNYFFKPNHIIVKVNRPVELVASRESGMTPHNLVIRAPEAGVVIEEDLGGGPKKIAFTPKKAGKYAFYCSKKPPLLASHRERGMEGVLEVVP
jgi:plastocyanin